MSTLKVDQILKRTGTGTITLGQSGDTIALGSGASQTGFGGTMTPSFCATVSSNQSVSSSTTTKIQFNTEVFDTDSAYDNSSNYRFTVPSGKAGKYAIIMDIHVNNSDNGGYANNVYLYKNGSLFKTVNNHFASNTIQRMHFAFNFIDDSSVGDYYECYANVTGSNTVVEGGTRGSTFIMYKIII